MSVPHLSPHPRARQPVTVDAELHMTVPGPHQFVIEDWADRVFGQSWMSMNGNPAALIYAMRSATAGLPMDDEVVYGKSLSGRGHLVHVREIGGAQ
ncbi:hypothetical protein ACH4C6_07465 [Streptomyces sp. NPDC017943]|uniref:hypothetical protein n=1 Tax=Streptomyces sp. NPDC017943 TaxID=3365019 RepID=UPI00379B753F